MARAGSGESPCSATPGGSPSRLADRRRPSGVSGDPSWSRSRPRATPETRAARRRNDGLTPSQNPGRVSIGGGLLHTPAAGSSLPRTSVERRDPVPAPLHTTVQRVIVDPVEDRQRVRPVRLPPALPKIVVELDGCNPGLIVIPLTAGAAAR